MTSILCWLCKQRKSINSIRKKLSEIEGTGISPSTVAMVKASPPVGVHRYGDWETIFSNTEKEILNNQFKEWLIEFEYI